MQRIVNSLLPTLFVSTSLLLCSSNVAAISADDVAKATRNVNAERVKAADSEPGNWLAHGRTYGEQRFSPLNQINVDNVTELGLAWSFDTGTKRGLEASPIVVDGVMYTTGSWSMVYALDAKTGKLLWKHDPQVDKAWGVYACCDVVNRGVALWEGTVYVGTIDGRLVALNAVTGDVIWETETFQKTMPYTITGAPRVVNGKVIIGNGGAEYGVRGYVTAYDAKTGEQVWRFYTVPGNPDEPFESEAMKTAAETWKGGKWWEVGGGGTVWDSMAYDPKLNLLYIGVGNGSPWNRYIRSPGGGDNLYLSSIVALNPDTGDYVWHYQTTPGDSWDYTATQHMILTELNINGQPREIIMQAPKNGFFYVLDRATGELLSAEPYIDINWATHVDMATGRPVENPEFNYKDGPKMVRPAPFGGHNWHPMSYSLDTGLVYIPAIDTPFNYAPDENYQYNPRTWNTGVSMAGDSPEDPILLKEIYRALIKGHLIAWDPVQQKEAWRVQHSKPWNGGVLSTAGNLVFQGNGDAKIAAYRADNGKKLWETSAQTGVIAPPVTYQIDGEQYVTVMAGWGGAFGLAGGSAAKIDDTHNLGRVLTYKLGGETQLPPLPKLAELPQPPELTATEEEVAKGKILYGQHCAACHGGGAVSAGVLPDLRHLSEAKHNAFDSIVLGGAYSSLGMVSFAELLSEEDANNIHAYLIKRSHDEIEENDVPGWLAGIKSLFYRVVLYFKTL